MDRYLELLTQNGILLIWGIIFQWITCLTTVHRFVFLYYLVWSWFFFLDNFLLCHGNTWQQCWRASISISVWLLQYTIRKALVREAIFFLFLILTFHNKESTAVTNKRMHMRQHAEHLGPVTDNMDCAHYRLLITPAFPCYDMSEYLQWKQACLHNCTSLLPWWARPQLPGFWIDYYLSWQLRVAAFKK